MYSSENAYAPEFISIYFGNITFQPKIDFVAGEYSYLHFRITVGEYGIDDGGHVKIAWPATNSFGIPQFENVDKENYTRIYTNSDVKIKYQFNHSNYVRPFMPCLTVKIFDGSIREGGTIDIIMGDQSEGGPGLQIQTYVENDIEFKVLLDPFGTNHYIRLADSPRLNVLPGQIDHLTVINPSEVEVGEKFWVSVRGNDKIGNTASDYTAQLSLSTLNKPLGEFTIPKNKTGSIRIENIQIDTSGIFYIHAKDKNLNLETVGNPIHVVEKASKLKLFWGDLHGQTVETIGSGTIQEYLNFGKNISALDFISHAANAFQITNEIWKNTQSAIKDFHEPNRYVTFLGYEWSGVTSAGGDHNVYYLNDDQQIHRCSHALIEDKSDLDTDRYPVSKLYEEFKGRNDVIIIPHIGGRRATLDIFDEDLSPFIEISSVHGHFEWFAHEALEKNLKTGFIASSDTHSGRPGDTIPVSYIEAVKGGITGVYSKELTRESLWQAFKARHVYGTTGARINIKFEMDEYIMGDVCIIDGNPMFNVNVIGTGPIESVKIHRGLETIYNYPILKSKAVKPNKMIIRWTGARTKYRRRNINWSGSLKIQNGQFLSVKAFAFDLPWEGISSMSENEVHFVSTTAGDYDGLIVEYEGNQDVIIEFISNVINTSIKPNADNLPIIKHGGFVDLALEIHPVYEEEYPRKVSFNFSDNTFDGESAAYYLTILQLDGEKAWTSPIFVNWKK